MLTLKRFLKLDEEWLTRVNKQRFLNCIKLQSGIISGSQQSTPQQQQRHVSRVGLLMSDPLNLLSVAQRRGEKKKNKKQKGDNGRDDD